MLCEGWGDTVLRKGRTDCTVLALTFAQSSGAYFGIGGRLCSDSLSIRSADDSYCTYFFPMLQGKGEPRALQLIWICVGRTSRLRTTFWRCDGWGGGRC